MLATLFDMGKKQKGPTLQVRMRKPVVKKLRAVANDQDVDAGELLEKWCLNLIDEAYRKYLERESEKEGICADPSIIDAKGKKK